MKMPEKLESLRLPSRFISHGTPMAALLAENPEEDAYANALRSFAEKTDRPKAIVVVSAHGTSSDDVVEISSATRPRQVWDFRGFPGKLYQIEYPCPGDPVLAAKIATRFSEKKIHSALSTGLEMDHGVWVPLSIMYPKADIPVVQIFMPAGAGPETLLKMGQSLASLREEGVLILGSGGAVHNLSELVWHGKEGKGSDWALEFEAWLVSRLEEKDVSAITQYLKQAPHAMKAQPTDEHILPLFFALGASLLGDEMRPIFRGVQYGSLSMFSFELARIL
jgi:4,5-DOPA dioxygenase extradiol